VKIDFTQCYTNTNIPVLVLVSFYIVSSILLHPLKLDNYLIKAKEKKREIDVFFFLFSSVFGHL